MRVLISIKGYKSIQIRYETGHHASSWRKMDMIRLLKGRKNPARFQDGVVAIVGSRFVNRIVKEEGFSFLNIPKCSIFDDVFSCLIL